MVEHGDHLYNLTESWIEHGNLISKYLNRNNNLTEYGDVSRGWNVLAGSEAYPAGHAVGESGVGKNMQPYLALNIWQKIAD